MTPWPSLKYDEWSDTARTLHMWTQVIGKIRMAKAPPVNHWWHVTLYVTSRGLTTSPIPNGAGTFEIELDFIDHRLRIATTEGDDHEFALQPMTVAAFYERVMEALAELGVDVVINTMPSECEDPVAFERDTNNRSYDAAATARFWRAMVDTGRVFAGFRSEFLGKVSPIHYFWGGMDLAMTRFSGRPAPPHPPVQLLPLSVVREAYSHEVCSAGFWPGGSGFDTVFYAYAYPEPEGLAQARIQPAEAFYHSELREFVLPYEAVRKSGAPEAALMSFLQSTYTAAANLARWDRNALERRPARA